MLDIPASNLQPNQMASGLEPQAYLGPLHSESYLFFPFSLIYCRLLLDVGGLFRQNPVRVVVRTGRGEATHRDRSFWRMLLAGTQ